MRDLRSKAIEWMLAFMRLAQALVLALTATLAAQEPLVHPARTGALSGVRVCIDPLVGDYAEDTLRASIYLGRLLRIAGAQVATTRFSFGAAQRLEATDKTITAARADLLIQIGRAKSASVSFGKRPSESTCSLLEGRLAKELAARLETKPSEQGTVTSNTPSVTVMLTRDGDKVLLAHRKGVHLVYRSIKTWWDENNKVILRLRSKTHPTPTSRPSTTKLIAGFWPGDHPPQTEAEVMALIRAWRKVHTAHPTQVYLEAKITKTASGWTLRGATELPMLARALRDLLKQAGVSPLSGNLRVLPEAKHGSPYGRVIEAATTWSQPGRATGMSSADVRGQGEETQVLVDERVLILDQRDDHLLIHSASGYLGWTRASAIERGDPQSKAKTAKAPGPGYRVAQRAFSKLGIPYLYGGRSSFGIDCSGLAQTSWQHEGVYLPRDARTQILAGRLVATKRITGDIQPGDLLFFLNDSGRLSHVAVSLGGSRFVHATPPEVTLGSLDPKDPWYSQKAKDFVMAKRVAGQ